MNTTVVQLIKKQVVQLTNAYRHVVLVKNNKIDSSPTLK
jgi:hypothetical protein